MTIIINVGKSFSSIDGVFVSTSDAVKAMVKGIKEQSIKKVIDNEDTLMYVSRNSNNNES